MYYNTTKQEGRTLFKMVESCRAQDEAIIGIYKEIGRPLSPSDVHSIFNQIVCKYANTPITSVRRAITNLTKSGRLIKTEQQKPGIYDRPEYLWKLPAPIASQQSLF